MLLQQIGLTRAALLEEAGRLLARQRPDGSWGGAIFLLADRIVCTLAAVIALRINRTRRPQVAPAISDGVQFLNARLAGLQGEVQETGAYELLVPSLYEEAGAMGLGVQTPLPPMEYP